MHSATRKDQVNQLQEHLNSIDPHIKVTIDLPGTDGLPFLDNLTTPTPNSIESKVYRKPAHTGRYLDHNFGNHPISAKLSVIHTLIHRGKEVSSTSEFLAKKMDHLYKVIQDSHYQAQFFQQGKPQQKTNGKPNPSTGKFIGARVVIPYIKGLSEQYRHTLAKYRVRVFFKGTSTITSLLMHAKVPIPDAQKTDIIYHCKCPAKNRTVEYIGETNRSLKERVSDHRNQTTSAIRNHHISTKHPKAEVKDFFTIIDRESNTLHHQAKEAHHICIKYPSLNRNIGKVRIPSVFNKLLNPPRQLELPHSSIPHPRGTPSLLGLSTQRQLTPHTFLIAIYNRSVIPMFTPFKLQDN